eukprot:655820-Alexandrium_andersonii.AAC.1
MRGPYCAPLDPIVHSIGEPGWGLREEPELAGCPSVWPGGRGGCSPEDGAHIGGGDVCKMF